MSPSSLLTRLVLLVLSLVVLSTRAQQNPISFLDRYSSLPPPSPTSNPNRVMKPCTGAPLASSSTIIISTIDGPSTCPPESTIGSGDFVEVLFVAHTFDTCELLDMTALDESYTFQMGRSDVIEGWEKGLVGACEGQVRRLTIPSGLAYGAEGFSTDFLTVPPNAALVYTIEVLHVKQDVLPSANVDMHPSVKAKLARLERSKKHNTKIVAPRKSKHRNRNLKKTNHPRSQEALMKKHRIKEERKMRRAVRARRLSSDSKGGTAI